MLEREQRLAETRARLYAAEILLGIEDLHDREVVFSDLTTYDILLDEDGHVSISDLGLSHAGLVEFRARKLSDAFSVQYVPEVVKGQSCTKMTDWYCFGVVIHEMLTGKLPFWNRSKEQVIKNVSAGVLKLPVDLSKKAKNLLYLLLNRNPTKRLGAKEGAEEVKKHPWFEGIDWELAKQRKLPVPAVEHKRVIKENQTWNSIGIIK